MITLAGQPRESGDLLRQRVGRITEVFTDGEMIVAGRIGVLGRAAERGPGVDERASLRVFKPEAQGASPLTKALPCQS
jgi:hypothetical protein